MAFKFNPFTGNLDNIGPEVTALNTLGVKADLATIQAIVGPTVGDVWQADDTDIFYLWDGSAWVSLGTLGTVGPAGPTGPAGADGADGADGVGVVAGGTTGQALVKASNTDYDTQWATPQARTTTAAGTLPATSYAAITYAASVALDLASLDGQYRTISLTGDLTLTTSNLATGRTVVIRIIADASQRTLTFPANWKFLGTKPANIAASKTGVLSLTFFGSADADCVAAWGVQG